MWMSCSARYRENNTRVPEGNALKGAKHCFHEIVNRKIVKFLIYTVNYCYFVCEWDIIYLLYKWSTFVVLFNVSWLQINTVCMFLNPVLLCFCFCFCSVVLIKHLFQHWTQYYIIKLLQHMGHKYWIMADQANPILSISNFFSFLFLCFVCANQKVQCDFLKSVWLKQIQTSAWWDICTPFCLFYFFGEAKYLSDMWNDSQTVWRCTHTEGGFGVPCVTHWLPSGMRSSMQPAHFRGNSRSPALQLEHREKNKHGRMCNKLEPLQCLLWWFLNSLKVFLCCFHQVLSLWNCLRSVFASLQQHVLAVCLATVQLHGEGKKSFLVWRCICINEG